MSILLSGSRPKPGVGLQVFSSNGYPFNYGLGHEVATELTTGYNCDFNIADKRTAKNNASSMDIIRLILQKNSCIQLCTSPCIWHRVKKHYVLNP